VTGAFCQSEANGLRGVSMFERRPIVNRFGEDVCTDKCHRRTELAITVPCPSPQERENRRQKPAIWRHSLPPLGKTPRKLGRNAQDSPADVVPATMAGPSMTAAVMLEMRLLDVR
jgi:hypothetical protein